MNSVHTTCGTKACHKRVEDECSELWTTFKRYKSL